MEKTVQLTKELGNDGRLSLLDIVVSRKEDGAITTEVYTKPTHSRQYLNYHSYCPMEHKEAVDKGVFRGARSHSIDSAINCKEEQIVVNELRSN